MPQNYNYSQVPSVSDGKEINISSLISYPKVRFLRYQIILGAQGETSVSPDTPGLAMCAVDEGRPTPVMSVRVCTEMVNML